MTDRISVPTMPGRALARAIGFLVLTPIGAGLILLGLIGVSHENWFSGLFFLFLGVPSALYCFAQITTAMRAANPAAEMLVLSKKTFFDCRIMKHPVPWSELEWETCPRTEGVYIRVSKTYRVHMHRALPDRFMVWVNRRLGRFDYAVASINSGLPKGALAYEMRMHRRPSGAHKIRNSTLKAE